MAAVMEVLTACVAVLVLAATANLGAWLEMREQRGPRATRARHALGKREHRR